MSIYHNALNQRQYKAATGLGKEQFEELFSIFGPLYTPKEGNPYYNDKKPVLTDKREALFFILHYYKAYPTLQNLGLYFGFSEYTASTYLDLLKPLLKAALLRRSPIRSAVFRDQQDFDRAFEGVDEIYIDVTEVPVERPQNNELQQEKYSGKKKPIRQSGS